MIDKALSSLKSEIQDYLKSIPDLNITSASSIELTPLVKEDGSVSIPKDSLGLTLINIEEEKIHKAQLGIHKSADGKVMQFNPDIKLNLFVLLAANFNTYSTALKFLSAAIGFFQAKNVFTPDNTPSLDISLQKLIVELSTSGMEQQNHLWGYLGAKYLPSVIYKVKLIKVQENLAQSQLPGVFEMAVDAGGT